jgi:hypothetical protein
VFDPKLIAKRYMLKGLFFFDLISSIPFEKLVADNYVLPALGMFKLFRVARI